MTHISKLLGVMVLIGLPAMPAGASSVPVQAKVREIVTRLNSDGTQTVLRESSGEFYRNSMGSELTITQPAVFAAPNETRRIGMLNSVDSGNLVRIDYTARKAYVIGRFNGPVRFRDMPPPKPEQVLGTEMYNGVLCTRVKGLGKAHNINWLSFDYDLFVRTEFETVLDGVNVMMVRELYDIQLNSEPAGIEFSVPAGFELLDRKQSSSSQCKSCPLQLDTQGRSAQ